MISSPVLAKKEIDKKFESQRRLASADVRSANHVHQRVTACVRSLTKKHSSRDEIEQCTACLPRRR